MKSFLFSFLIFCGANALSAGAGFPEKYETGLLPQIKNLTHLEIEMPFYPQERHVGFLNQFPFGTQFRHLGQYPRTDRDLALLLTLNNRTLEVRSSNLPDRSAYQQLARYPGSIHIKIMNRVPDTQEVEELKKADFESVTFEWNNLPDSYKINKIKSLKPFHLEWYGALPSSYDTSKFKELPLKSLTFIHPGSINSSDISRLANIRVPYTLIRQQIPQNGEVSYLNKLNGAIAIDFEIGVFPYERDIERLNSVQKFRNCVLVMPVPYPYNKETRTRLNLLNPSEKLIFRGQYYPSSNNLEHLNGLTKPFEFQIHFKPGAKSFEALHQKTFK